MDYGAKTLIHAAHACSIKAPNVVRFIDDLLAAHDHSPTVIVLDNASIHHGIDEATRERWLIDHKAVLFYLPAYSPELNKIEIVWRQLKFRWRCFVTWTKETVDAELADLLAGYGTKFQTNFS
ncbi:transposase [Burkholderia cepacia]|uniref:Transposase n=1 Tax=Burkholderia cepacia TaxID=292 RepID=A0A2S8HLP0_BURCE|nr:transposase [Burkholderia cepacia]PQP03433.1 transposase [Burkholderia cepacia]